MNWNRTVLRIAGSKLDYLAIHHYYGLAEMQGDDRNLMAHPLRYEQFYKQVAQMFRELVPGREIKLAINEWNTSLPLPRQHSMESALYAARLMNVFERSDIVAMSAVSDFVNGWSGGVIQASRHGVFVTPTYLVNELYSRRFGTERLRRGRFPEDARERRRQFPRSQASPSPDSGRLGWRSIFFRMSESEIMVGTRRSLSAYPVVRKCSWQLPTVASALRRPNPENASQQGDLPEVVAVVHNSLPEHGKNR